MPRVRTDKFFQEQSAQSRVKADIVYKYVIAWARVFLTSKSGRPLAEEVALVDFFSGPGTYEDGNESTPLLVARKVLSVPPLREGVRMFFNDANPALVQSLRQEMEKLPDYGLLRHQPKFTTAPASIDLLESLGLGRNTPQLFFLDQFGYADVTPELIRRVFLARRCDCLFFVRTSRVVAAVTNRAAESAMIGLFGKERLDALRVAFLTPRAPKEHLVLDALAEVMRGAGAPYFQGFPFRIRHEGSSKQHLIYLGKHEKGLSIIKEIMSKSSSSDEAGVPIIGFAEGAWTRSLFEPDPIDNLVQQLKRAYAGTRLTVGQIFSHHHPNNDRFLLKHYQEALRRMESSGLVYCEPAVNERPKRNGRVTMSETVNVMFRKQGEQ